MGMLDFLKHDPEDDYEFDDDELMDDEEFDDEEFDDDDFDDEPVKSKPIFSFFGDKNKKDKEEEEDLLKISPEEEEEALSMGSRSRSRFSTDFAAYLEDQVQAAQANLDRRTREAYEMIRQTAGQPVSSDAIYNSNISDEDE
ncbi:MAG: hypothetical protein KBS83_02865 [Lachnospiraceae bacterium]|nr:hypothetical protein [Candidatus Equihabitans merdae]